MLLSCCWIFVSCCWAAAGCILVATGLLVAAEWILVKYCYVLSKLRLSIFYFAERSIFWVFVKSRLRNFLVKIYFGRVMLKEERGSDYEQPFARREGGCEWCQLLCKTIPQGSDVDIPRDHHVSNESACMNIYRHTTWPVTWLVTWLCKHGTCLKLNIEPITLNLVPTLLEILLLLPLCYSKSFSFILFWTLSRPSSQVSQ